MKHAIRVILVALVLVVPASVFAQHDFAVWSKVDQSDVTVIPWYVYNGSSLLVDARYNFDQQKTAGAFVGRAFEVRGVSVMPYAGALVGDYDGISTQINAFAGFDVYTVFVMNQYSRGIGEGHADFIYHWVDALWHPNPRLALGIDGQVYKESGIPLLVDVGPVVKILPASYFYVKAWGTVDPKNSWDKKFFVGIGFLPDEWCLSF